MNILFLDHHFFIEQNSKHNQTKSSFMNRHLLVKNVMVAIAVTLLVTSSSFFPILSMAEDSGAPKLGIFGYQKLVEGNKRFYQDIPLHPAQDKPTRQALTSSQKPFAIVLSCSDSRVPPEIIFDQGLGQIFSVRTAGHVVDAEAIGSIEYALEHLGTNLLVVMGHDSCGAVKATLNTPEGESSGSFNIDQIINVINRHLETLPRKRLNTDPLMTEAVKANVNGVIKDLVAQSKLIQEFIEKGKLTIASAIYHLHNGRVEFWSVGIPVLLKDTEKEQGAHKRIPAQVRGAKFHGKIHHVPASAAHSIPAK